MRDILRKVFRDQGFCEKTEERMSCPEPSGGPDEIFVNAQDEMYFLMTGELRNDTLSRIISVCAEEEKNEFYKKRWKSNWVLVYITEIPEELTKEQKRIVMQIEENKFFCRKYVFWYSDQEKEALKEFCGNVFSKEVLHEKVSDDKAFNEFKKEGHRGYECLSRLYIKLPFLGLEQMPATEDTIFTCVYEELRSISEIAAELFKDGEIEGILNEIELEGKNLKEVEKKLKNLEKAEKTTETITG